MDNRTETFYRIRHEIGTEHGWIKIYLRRENEGSSPTWVTKPGGASEYSNEKAIDLCCIFGGVIEEVTVRGSNREEINCSVIDIPRF